MKTLHRPKQLSLWWFAGGFLCRPGLACAAEAGAGDVTLGQLWRQGGWAMYPLAAFSVLTLALIIYNALRLREPVFLRPDVTSQLGSALSRGEIEAAAQLCRAQPCLIANITRAGLERLTPGLPDLAVMDKAMEEAAAEEVAAPFVIISYLSIIATLSPLVGMLGTVSGMIKAFRNIALGGMGKPELLADNISEALITTAVGLIVGIPAMFAFFYFKSRYAKLTSRIARRCGDLQHQLSCALAAARNGPRVVDSSARVAADTAIGAASARV